ncbi:hypothetical protein [Paracoccus marinaquae]|uniref:Sulfotransferase family protein n=1 Tax=Paracoccus marinaquae TaxID=2841926 RepID=A0ABS6AH89_9RHOB|nr:hypothetical protein [Paracoccus marinaquae]MBU3029963.1 hypothetical protein [Paracoccus marinaquae]
MAEAAQAKAGRRLIVHLGVHKTGSTAIQRHLHRNAAALARRLILRTPWPDQPMQALGRAAQQFSLAPGGDTRKALRIALEDVLETLPANDLPVILSHENLAGAPPGKGQEIRLYPALPRIAELIRQTAGGFEVDFVIYTRSMETWRASLWAQIVRSEGYAGALADFLTDTADLPGWDDLGHRMAEAVGQDRIRCFRLEDEAEHARPGRQLLRHAGLSDAEIAALPPLEGASNERLSHGATEFLRRLNGLSLNPHARRKVVDLVASNQFLFTADQPSAGTL